MSLATRRADRHSKIRAAALVWALVTLGLSSAGFAWVMLG